MKFEAGQLNLVLTPENERDVYNLGIISTKLNCEIQFTSCIGGKNIECDALLINYRDLIAFLADAKP